MRRTFTLAALIALPLTGLSTAASAHIGDHSHMTFAELADHLTSSPDHRLAIMAVVLVMAVATGAILWTSRKPRRRPETPKI